MNHTGQIFADAVNGFIQLRKLGYEIKENGKDITVEDFKEKLFRKLGVGARIATDNTVNFIDGSMAWVANNHWESQAPLEGIY